MAQQTALEFFIEKTTESGHLWLTDKPNDVIELTKIIKQAKQMEKEQIINAWEKAYSIGCVNGGNDYVTEKESDTGINYYKETYNK